MKLSQLVHFSIAPVVLGLHYVTNHTAWLYVFGVLCVTGALLGIIGVVAAILTYANESTTQPIAFPTWAAWLGGVWQIGTLSYLLWTESYIVATLYLITAAVSWMLIGCIKIINDDFKKRQADIAARAQSITNSDAFDWIATGG